MCVTYTLIKNIYFLKIRKNGFFLLVKSYAILIVFVILYY